MFMDTNATADDVAAEVGMPEIVESPLGNYEKGLGLIASRIANSGAPWRIQREDYRVLSDLHDTIKISRVDDTELRAYLEALFIDGSDHARETMHQILSELPTSNPRAAEPHPHQDLDMRSVLDFEATDQLA